MILHFRDNDLIRRDMTLFRRDITAGRVAGKGAFMKTDGITIDEMELSLTAFLCLKRAGYRTLGSLMRATRREIMEIPQLTRRNLEEICGCMDRYGVGFSRLEAG